MASLRLSIVVWILISGVSLFICQFLPAQDNEKGNDVTQAIIRYQKTIAENPDSVEARLSLGLAYLAYDILEEAILAFQKTIELDPKSEKGNYWLGRTYQLQKKYEESIAIFRELIRLFPNHGEIYIQLGLSYFQLHQHKEAEEAFLRSIHLIQPTESHLQHFLPSSHFRNKNWDWINKIATTSRADIYYYLSRISLEQGLLEEAETYCHRSIQIQPLADTHFQLGLVSIRKKKWETAEEAFVSAIQQDPSLPYAHYQLALLYFKQGKKAKAEREMKMFQQWERDETDPFSHQRAILVNNLGTLYLNEGKHEKAIQYYQRAISYNPNLVEAYNGLGRAFSLLKRFSQANQAQQQAIQLNPKMAEAHAGLGFIRLKKAESTKDDSDYKLALNAYRQARKLQPNLPEVLLNLGNIALKLSLLQEAKNAFYALLSLSSDFTDQKQSDRYQEQAHLALGELNLRQEKLLAAHHHYYEVLKGSPNLVIAHYRLGIVASKQGKFDEAIEHYNTVLKSAPDMVEVHYLMGRIYAEREQYQQAENAYQRVIKAKPSFADAYERLAHLYGSWGKYQNKALELARKAVELQPSSAAYLNTLSWLYYLQKNYDRAEETIKKALSLKSNNRVFQEGLKAIQEIKELEKNNAKK